MRASAFLAVLAFCLTHAAPGICEPASLDSAVERFAGAMAHANYETSDKAARAAEAEAVAAQAATLAQQFPGRAEPLVWQGVALATAGGAKGGTAGLAEAKAARDILERAEAINPTAQGALLYTVLGSLYAKAPGFPLGFGDPGKARAYLLKAVAVNPAGLDNNYAMGEFLMRQKDFAGAVRALEKALAAPPRPGRMVADRGKRAEATALLVQARAAIRP